MEASSPCSLLPMIEKVVTRDGWGFSEDHTHRAAAALCRGKIKMGLLNRLLGFYTMVADATKEFFIRILMGVLIFLGYVLLSLFIYAVMRRIMVPQKLHVIPVHLQYRYIP